MRIKITTKNAERTYHSENVEQAIRLFIQDILASRLPKEGLGVMGVAHCGEVEIPFRIGPALCKAGWFSTIEFQDLLQRASPDLRFSVEEIEEMMIEDSWMVEACDPPGTIRTWAI